jgi:hypothetical protein
MSHAASTAPHPLSAGSLALVVCCSAIGLAFGIAHYRGWHRGWIRVLPFEANFFTPAWGGATGLLTALCLLAAHVSRWLEVVLGVPLFLAFAVTLMSLVWLPQRLLPAWYREWRDRGRPSRGLSV